LSDVFSKQKRSEVMSNIKSSNTKPEKQIRSLLHNLGYKFRLHDKKIPGKPDLKLSKYNTVILINGCFWHRHNCHLFKPPKSNVEFWDEKLDKNRDRDLKNIENLIELDWRVLVIWECAIKGKQSLNDKELASKISLFLNSNFHLAEITGNIG